MNNDMLIGNSYSTNNWGKIIPTPSSPKGFHGNPVYVSFGNDVWLFLENLKATKHAFYFYSKTDLVSMITNPLTTCIYTTSPPQHTHTPEETIVFSFNLGAAQNLKPSHWLSFSTCSGADKPVCLISSNCS